MERTTQAILFAAAMLLLIPPGAVLILEGPVWPAIQFAAIQIFLVFTLIFATRGFRR